MDDNSTIVTLPIYNKTDTSFDFVRFDRIQLDDVLAVSFKPNSTYNLRVAKTITVFGCTFKIPLYVMYKVPCRHYEIVLRNKNNTHYVDGVRYYTVYSVLSICDPFCKTGRDNIHYVGEVV